MFPASERVLPPPQGVWDCASGYGNGTTIAANPANGLRMLIQKVLIIGTSPLMCIHRLGSETSCPDGISPVFATEAMGTVKGFK